MSACDTFRCPALPDSRVFVAAFLSIPWLCTAVLCLWFLHLVDFKFMRIPGAVAKWTHQLTWFELDSFSTRAFVFFTVNFIRFIIAFPFVYSVIWGIIVTNIFEEYYEDYKFPFLIGFTIAMLPLFFLLVAYGFSHWRFERFRMTSVPRMCFGLAIVAIFSLQIAYILVIVNDYQSTFAVFVSWNLVLLILNSHLHHYERDPLDFTSFLHLKPKDALADKRAATKRARNRRLIFLNYFAALLLLLTFALIVYKVQNSRAGWEVLVAVFFMDVAVGWLWWSDVTSSVFAVNALTIAGRVSLLAFGPGRVLLAVSVNYLLFSLLLIFHVVDSRFPLVNSVEALDQVIGGLQANLERRLYKKKHHIDEDDVTLRARNTGLLGDFLSAPAEKVVALVQRLPWLRAPITNLTFLTLAFMIFISIAGYAHASNSALESEIFPPVTLTDSPHAQYQFGLFALLVTWGFCAALVSYRVYAFNKFTINVKVVVSAAAFLIFTIPSSVALAQATGSDFVLVFGIFSPLIFIFAVITYFMWWQKGYRWNTYIFKLQQKLKRQRTLSQPPHTGAANEQTQALPGQHRSSVVEQLGIDVVLDVRTAVPTARGIAKAAQGVYVTLQSARDFFLYKHSTSDYVILVCACITGLLVFFVGYTLSKVESENAAWITADAVGLVLLMVFFFLKWIHTFSWGIGLLLGAVALLGNMGYFLDSAGSSAAVISAAYFLVPASIFIAMAIVAWQANSWKIATREKRLLSLGALSVLIFIIVLATGIASWPFALVAIVTWCLGVLFMFMGVRWASQEFYLEPFARRVFLVLSVSIDAIVLGLVLASGAYWFWSFTVVFAYLFLLTVIAAIQGAIQTQARHYFPSRWLFPVYEFNSAVLGDAALVEASLGYGFALLATVELMVWGVMCACLVEPNFIGWCVYSAGVVILFVIVMHLIYSPPYHFWRAWQELENYPSHLETAKRSALAAELKLDAEKITEGSNDMESLDMVMDGSDAAPQNASDMTILEEAEGYLKYVRIIWQRELSHLLYKRKKLLMQANSVNEKLPNAVPLVEKLDGLDRDIRRTYQQQSRIVVRFMITIIAAAEQVRKQKTAVLRDFLRKAKGDKRLQALQIPDIENATLLEIQQWATEHNDTLQVAIDEYIESTLHTIDRQTQLDQQEQEAARRRHEREQQDRERRDREVQEQLSKASNEDEQKNIAPPVPPYSPCEDAQRARAITLNNEHLNIMSTEPDEVKSNAAKVFETIRANESRLKESGRAQPDIARVFIDPNFPTFTEDIVKLLQDEPDEAPSPRPRPSLFNRPSHSEQKHHDTDHMEVGWRRPHEIISKELTVFGPDGPLPNDIRQGDLQDCYLLSAMSVLASVQQRVSRLFLVDQYNSVGIYGVQFFRDGVWKATFVDDQFPVRGRSLVFAKCARPEELWVAILEKCYAKIHRGYPEIVGGEVHDCLVELTGGSGERIQIESSAATQLWNRLTLYQNEKYLMGCGNPTGTSRDSETINGIVQGHAYAILDLREVDRNRLIMLKNPWGFDDEDDVTDQEWQGDWGNSSSLWTQRMRKVLAYDPEKNKKDGIFWMSFEDFVTNFKKIYVCRIFDHVSPILEMTEELAGAVPTVAPDAKTLVIESGDQMEAVSKWYKFTYSGRWTNLPIPESGERPVPDPQFVLIVSRPSLVFLSLAQPFQESRYPPIGLFVVFKDVPLKGKQKGVRVKTLKLNQLAPGQVQSKFRPTREFTAEVQLEPDKRYTVYVSPFDPKHEGDFTLTAYSRHKFKIGLLTPEDAID